MFKTFCKYIVEYFKIKPVPYRIPKTWHLKKSHLNSSVMQKGKTFITNIKSAVVPGDYLVVEIINPPILCKIKKSEKVIKNEEEYYKIVFYKVPCKLCRVCGKLFELVDVGSKCPRCKTDDN